MENKQNNNEKRTYVKPEAQLFPLRLQENIATSQNLLERFFDDEFNGSDDVFD